MDVVWISAVLEHVPEFEKVLAEAARIGRNSFCCIGCSFTDGPTESKSSRRRPMNIPMKDFHIPHDSQRCGVRFGRAECRADHPASSLGRLIRRRSRTLPL